MTTAGHDMDNGRTMHEHELQWLEKNADAGQSSVPHHGGTPLHQGPSGVLLEGNGNDTKLESSSGSECYTGHSAGGLNLEQQPLESSHDSPTTNGRQHPKSNKEDSPRGVHNGGEGDTRSTGNRRESTGKSSLAWPSFSREVPWQGVRDHLALERTFLGWLRTSGAFAMTGVLLAQIAVIVVKNEEIALKLDPAAELARKALIDASRLPPLEKISKYLGTFTVGLALCIMLIGLSRFYFWQNALIRGQAFSGGWSLTILSVAVLGFLLVVFILTIITTDP